MLVTLVVKIFSTLELTKETYPNVRGGGDTWRVLDFESVHRGIHTSDNFKHISNICSVSIFKKTY